METPNELFRDLKEKIKETHKLSIEDATEALCDIILDALIKQCDADREVIFQIIRENFCVYCGSEQGGRCTCRMDD